MTEENAFTVTRTYDKDELIEKTILKPSATKHNIEFTAIS